MTDVTLSRAETAVPQTTPGGFAAMFRWLYRRYVAARAADELDALDDRMLNDLGLTRGQINGAVRAHHFR
jgi:uncharacterized protein YjiS (DUF1127 family)